MSPEQFKRPTLTEIVSAGKPVIGDSTGKPVDAVVAVEEESRFPKPGDPYKAFITEHVSGRTAYMLHFMKASGEIYTKPYMQLDDMQMAQDRESFCLLFGGLEPKKITVHGRELLRFYDMIGTHRVHIVVQGVRDMGEHKAFVSRIDVEEWKEED